MPRIARWVLLAALVLLGAGYVFAFAIFVRDSEDFIAARRNSAAESFAAQHLVHPTAELKFAPGAPFNGILGAGWHNIEPHGVWSSATDSSIAIRLPRGYAGVVLQLNATAFIAPRAPHAIVTLTVNGHSQTWERNGDNAGEPLQMRVPEDLLRAGRLDIHVHLSRVASPFATRAGRDHRPLGILLSSIVIQADAEKAVSVKR